ncbi:MAG: hypothetical protein KDC54_20310, partial [Lewinella sp.]|nr:hypothetical protein [Lewinella sp.]
EQQMGEMKACRGEMILVKDAKAEELGGVFGGLFFWWWYGRGWGRLSAIEGGTLAAWGYCEGTPLASWGGFLPLMLGDAVGVLGGDLMGITIICGYL